MASEKDIERLCKQFPTIAGDGDGWWDDDEEGFQRFAGAPDAEPYAPKRPHKKKKKK